MKYTGRKFNLIGLIVLLAMSYSPSMAQNANTSSYKSKSTTKTHQYRSNSGVSSSDLEYRGKIVFTDDDRDIKSISSGGFIKFSKRTFGTKRTILFEGNSNGTITREYYEGGRELPFEPEGRKWMESMLPEIIRTTGLGAEVRVARFYKNGGIKSVLSEIEEINSNYVAGIYYNEVFKMNGISSADLTTAVKHAGTHVSSSYEMSNLLIGNMDQLLASKVTSAAMVEAATSISSDYEQAKVYKSVLKSNVDDNTVLLVINGLDNISSDYEKSNILQVLMNYQLSDMSLALVLEEIGDMSSSYEQSKVLLALIKEQGLNEITTTMLLATADDISSDYEKTRVVQALISSNQLSNKEVGQIAEFSQNISSDYEQSKLLQQLANDESIDESGIDVIIEMTSSVSSSYEQTRILYAVLASNNFHGNNFSSILEASDNISSDYEKSRVLSQVINHKNLEDKYYNELIEAVSTISSRYEKAKLLMAMVPNLPDDAGIKETFLEVAEDLSDSDYGKIMRALIN